jgi:serine/threonine protein kinase
VQIGRKLGPYEVVSLLGAGGMGEVYTARDTRLNRNVALKVLPPEFAADGQRRSRFETEAKAVAALSHPNIVALYDIGDEEGVVYSVSELIDGETLREARLPLRKAIEVAAQIADGLAAAHASGVTHRDLKPDNVMLTRDGRAKILDFGLAQVSRGNDDATVTAAGTVMGTPAYMSPEQARGEAVDARSDIFSFGAMLYELVAGKRAFGAATAAESMNAVLNLEPEELPEAVPAYIRNVISACLEKNREHRFQSARDLAFALRQNSGTRTSAQPARPARRNWMPAAAALACGLLIGALAAVRLVQMSDQALEPLVLKRLTTGPTTEDSPVFAPDGRSLVYRRFSGTRAELIVQSNDVEESAVLVSGGQIWNPQWTADGSRVCYSEAASIVCIGVAGGRPEPLLRGLSGLVDALFTRDGKSVLILRVEGGVNRLYESTPPGAAPRLMPGIVIPPGRANLYAVSNDGAKLAFLSGPTLWTVSLPAGAPKALALEPNNLAMGAAWLPDNRHLVYALSDFRSYTTRLILADTESDARRYALTYEGRTPISIGLSPDGKRLVYASGPTEEDLVEYALDGKRVRRIGPGSAGAWSPAGERIVYVKRGRQMETVGADGKERKPLPTDVGALRASYSPDGKRIAFGGNKAPLRSIEMIPAAGGRSVTLYASTGDKGLEGFCWSSDGEWIWFREGQDLRKVPSQGGAAITVKKTTDNPVCSPDGSIAYKNREGLFLLSGDGKQERRMPDGVPIGFGDAGRLLYVRRDGQSLSALDTRTGAAGPDVPLQLEPGVFAGSISVHPNGKSLLVSTFGRQEKLWEVTGFVQPATGWTSWLQHWEIPAPASKGK